MTDEEDMDSTARQFICPVCNNLMQGREVAVKIDHGVHAHYFCSEDCKVEFEKDPKKYH